ncbi:MAG: alpha/beta hydrolase [Alphaproteobacteria bacterium]|nr:alpha/beta hydrolase [Alphaproteobacteria bacterium]
MSLFPETQPLQSGDLPAEDGHLVHWETFGTASRPAMLLLHGGPGGGVRPRMPRLFDPDRWHIIAMDQRGAGRSRPHAGDDVAALTDNTTAHLIHDIERLRARLSIGQWHVFGSSWGTTLALAYAQAYPANVSGLILAAIATTTRKEIDFLYGGAGMFLPEAFEAFQAGAPEGASGVGLAAAYGDRLISADPIVQSDAAKAWCRWEESVIAVDPRAEPATRYEDPRFRLGFARVVTHYFRNLAWLDTPILDRMDRIAHLPAVLINSRLDLSVPFVAAWNVHRAMPHSQLVAIPGSLHGTLYGPLSDAVMSAGEQFANSNGRAG